MCFSKRMKDIANTTGLANYTCSLCGVFTYISFTAAYNRAAVSTSVQTIAASHSGTRLVNGYRPATHLDTRYLILRTPAGNLEH